MTFALSKRSKDRLEGVHPDLVAVVNLAIERTPLDFTVLEGLRSIERQRQLVAKGASKTMNSRHLSGHAVDLAPIDENGAVSWDWPLYHMLAPVVKQAAADLGVDLEWGGDWKSFKDGPHWQLSWQSYAADDMAPRARSTPVVEMPVEEEMPVPEFLTRQTPALIHQTPSAEITMTRAEAEQIQASLEESDSEDSSTIERTLGTKLRSLLTGGGGVGVFGYVAGAWDKFTALPIATQVVIGGVAAVVIVLAYAEYRSAAQNEGSRRRKGEKAKVGTMALRAALRRSEG